MLLRNLCPSKGLANGTRLVVLSLSPNLLQAKILTGAHVGHIAWIPRVMVQTSDPTMPVQFRRLQFPIRVAFAMTINKAQGQTMDRVGLYLPAPVFTHGQLYVAVTRVRERNNLVIMVAHDSSRQNVDMGLCTANVVFTEVFRG